VRNDRGCVFFLPTDRRDLDMQPLVELQRDVEDVEQLGAFGFRKAVLRACDVCYDDTVRIWDPTTGTCQHTLTAHTGALRALAAAPDSTFATAGNDHTVRIWEVDSGVLVPALATGYPLSLAAWTAT
jgi:hypothetical protein